MSLRRTLARGLTGAVALTGALALTLPGVASADETTTAPQAKPTVSAKVNGSKIGITITPPAGVECETSPVLLSPIDALPLVAGATVDFQALPKYGAPYTSTGTNTWTTSDLGDGIYIVAGACQSAEAGTYAYTFGFVPGSIIGTIPQVLNLGSTVMTMPGGMDLIMQIIGSDLLNGDKTSDGESGGETTTPGADTGAGDGNSAADPLAALGSLTAMLGGGTGGTGGAGDGGAGDGAGADTGAGGTTGADTGGGTATE